MNLEDVKKQIKSDLDATKDFDVFLKDEILPNLTYEGAKNYERLHFFNLGYEFAMQKINDILEKINDE